MLSRSKWGFFENVFCPLWIYAIKTYILKIAVDEAKRPWKVLISILVGLLTKLIGILSVACGSKEIRTAYNVYGTCLVVVESVQVSRRGYGPDQTVREWSTSCSTLYNHTSCQSKSNNIDRNTLTAAF